MKREEKWYCSKCNTSIQLPKPRHFISTNYSAACLKSHGVGSFQVPNPNKLIIHPEKPLCKGAMYSPGFFPKGYLCKPYNGGYYIIKALAKRHNFDTTSTSWKDMNSEAKKAFLYGDPKPLEVTFENRKRQLTPRRLVFKGFYGWVGEWDVGVGIHTDMTKRDLDTNNNRMRADTKLDVRPVETNPPVIAPITTPIGNNADKSPI